MLVMQFCRFKPAYLNEIRKICAARLSAGGCVQEKAEQLKTIKDIPGPASLPLIGQIHNFIPYIGIFGSVKNSYDMMHSIYTKYGPLVRIGPILKNPPAVFTFNPQDMELVLRNENTLPIRTGFDSLEYFRKHVKKEHFEGMSGLITDHGEEWKKFRSIVNPVLLQPNTIKLYAGALDEVSQDMVERLKRIRNADNKIAEDFEIEMNKWALESIALVGLGGRIGCLQDNLPENSEARQLIQCVRDCFEIMDKLDYKPSPWKYFWTPTYRKGMAVYEKQMKLSEFYVKKAIEDMKKRKNTDTEVENKSVLAKLLEIDEKVALIMASDMLFAGVDTAAHTMMTLLYNLAINPEKQDKLREEVRTGIEKKYVKACIKENMRLSPVIIGNVRRLTKDLKLQNYLIPKGVDVVLTHEYISRQESHYTRPAEYLPERWLVDKAHPLHHGSAHPMATLPFGHGVRSCIGRRVAELEVETFVARLVDSFEVQWRGPPPTFVTKSLNYMQPPYNFVFNDAK